MKRKLFSLVFLIMLGVIHLSKAQSNCRNLTVFLNRISTTEFAVSINPSDVYTGNFSGSQQLALDVSTFRWAPFLNINDIGNHTVTLTITDNFGNVSSCQSVITVILPGDPPPQAVCKNATIQLNQDGSAVLSASDIDDGSSSSVGIMNLVADHQTFTCTDIGANPVILTVTDFNGSVATCTSTVTVEDNIMPTAICKPLTIELDRNGQKHIFPSDIDEASHGACELDLDLDKSFFTCADLGNTSIVLTAKDTKNNQEATCNSTITVKDEFPPEANCKDITVMLNSNGKVTVTPEAVNHGSFDACGISPFQLDKKEFDCSNVGPNKVILTVIDTKGSIATCSAIINVVNLLQPDARCKNITLNLDKFGHASILADDIDNGSNAICGIKSLTIDKPEFNSADRGPNPVILTVTDNTGLSATCTSMVTVIPHDSLVGRVFNSSNTPVFLTNNFPLLAIDGQNNVMAGSTGSGLYIYKNENWLSVNNQFGMSGFITRAMRRNPANNEIWIGMSKSSPCLGQVGGVWVYTDGNFVKRYLPPPPPGGISESSSVLEMNSFLGAAGIGFVLPGGSTYLDFLSAYNFGLPSLVVRSLDFNKVTSFPWAGCTPQICEPGYNGGLAVLPLTDFTAIKAGMPPARNGDTFITAITSSSDGTVYSGVGRSCNNSCLSAYILKSSPTGDLIAKYDNSNTPLPLTTASTSIAIRSLYVDKKNRLWVGGELNGIGVLDTGGWHFLQNPLIPYNNNSFVNFDAITEGPDGTIFFGTSKGLLLFLGGDIMDPGNWNLLYLKATNVTSQSAAMQNIGSIKFDNKNNMWIGTRGEGIFYIKTPVVYNLVINLNKGRLIKKPFKGVKVRAINERTALQEGNEITTNDDGEFVGLDAQLNPDDSYTVKFKYTHDPADPLDRDFEFDFKHYRIDVSMDDILMPVKMLHQTRELLDKIHPEPPKEPRKYDLKVFDYSFNEAFERKTWDLFKVKNAIGFWNTVDNTNASDMIQNLGRLYLALYVHEAISANVYEIGKIVPKSLVSAITTLISLGPAKKALNKARAEGAYGVGSAEEETEDQRQAKLLETGLDYVAEAVKTGLEGLKGQFQGDEKTQNLIANIKAGVEDAFPYASASFRVMIGAAEPKAILEKALDLLKDKLTTLSFIGLYELYISQTQSMIDEAGDKMMVNLPAGSNFELAAANTSKIITDLSAYETEIKNCTEMFFANTQSESVLSGSLNTTTEIIDKHYWNALNHVGQTARDLITNLPLAKIISTGFNAINVVVAAEEGLRGIINFIENEKEANKQAFNPTLTSELISSHSSVCSFFDFSRTLQNNQNSASNQLRNTTSINDVIPIYNHTVDEIIQLIQNNQNTDASKKAGELINLDSLINSNLKQSSARLRAISSSAENMLPGFSNNYFDFNADYNKVLSFKSAFYVRLVIWFNDSTQVNRDTLSVIADSLKGANLQMNNSLETIESLTSNFMVDSTIIITNIVGPQIMSNGSVNNFMIRYQNFGTNNADSVYFLNKLNGRFTISPDSLFIGTVMPGDTGHIVVQVTAPSIDTFAVSRIELHVSNGSGDHDSYLVESVELCQRILYADKDGDGFGNPTDSITECEQRVGFVTNKTDCNDKNKFVHPGSAEICNGIDDNCDGNIDEGVLLTFYRDADGDGYGDAGDTIQACFPPAGYVPDSTDCNDRTASTHPSASELCNGLDDNCNGQVDEGVLISFYRDIDGDGYGNPLISVSACFRPEGYVSDNTDCNDARADAHPGMTEICNDIDDNCNGHIDEGCGSHNYYSDLDGDGFGNPNRTISTNAQIPPSGFVTDSSDCNDSRQNVHPGATEVCNGIDDNCNDQIDEGVQSTFFRDADGDGFGNAGITTQACSAPSGFVSNSTDCNDSKATVHPGGTEVCNGIDDNCNGTIDEGVLTIFFRDADVDGFGNAAITTQACSAPSGFVTNSTDCNDGNAAIHPGVTEVCNSIDDNCNGTIDEGVQSTFFRDADADGFGNAGITTQACSAPSGFVANSTDCNDGNASIHSGATEVCNGIDDNCNGQIDENVKTTFFRDADGDGFGNVGVTKDSCSAPIGFVANNTDCNDGNASIHPGATEVCNIADDNCNGQVDENVKTTFFRDADQDGFGNVNHDTLACTVPAGFVSNSSDCNDGNAAIHPGAIELCDSLDNNCNGSIDEGVKLTFYRDADRDGFGNASITAQACSAPAGFVADNTDCNDARTASHPGATELCNGMDDNCNGAIDEGVKTLFFRDADGDGFGNPGITNLACSASAGYVANSTDCDDGNAAVHPGATEICNGIDDDCNGVVDSSICDFDGDGFTIAQGDCNDLNRNVHSGVLELCNGIDDNCNGLIDEGCIITFNLKVFIEGFYTSNGLMRAVLFNNANSSDSTACDLISFQLRDSLFPHNVVLSISILLHTDGHATFLLPSFLLNHSYYLAIRHRNSLETWSKDAVFINSTTVSFDFTSQ